jgi:FtsZ-interacting cell division protein ZipA
MTWLVVAIVLAVLVVALAWASRRHRRHAGDASLDAMRTTTQRHQQHLNNDSGGG